MKKIICLIDYTLASENAVKYAAQLARSTSSKLVLCTLHHHNAPNKVLVLAGEEDERPYHSSRLPEMCDQMRGIWKVPCEYQEIYDDENEIQELLKTDVRLIIAGIKSSKQTTPQKLSNSINFKLIKDVQTPVLLIPDNVEYHKLSRMLYAYDYENEPEPPMDLLKNLAEWLQTDLRFLSVVDKEYAPEVEELMDERNAEILSHWKSTRILSFDYIYYSDVKKCIDHYLTLWQADDMVIFSIHHPSLMHRLFHKSVIKEMTVCSSYPILIIHK